MTETNSLPLPPPNLRWGGVRNSNDTYFLATAEANVTMLEQVVGLNRDLAILDLGCGSGRFLLGLLKAYGNVAKYVGYDIYKPMIDWAQAHLAPLSPNISFHWQDTFHARYNPKGRKAQGIELPSAGASFDLITLFSVFSHMGLADIRIYLEALHDLLKPDGRLYITLFVEYGVADEEENPPNYHRTWKGAQHCVRLNRPTFEALVDATGLRVDYFLYRHTPDGQSSYVLSRKDQPPFQARDL